MESLKKIKSMVCEELSEYANAGKLTYNSLQAIDLLTHTLKSIDTVMAMESHDKDEKPKA